MFFPDAIIAGVPKAGTSSLHRWLADHPDVSGSLNKETYFLADPGTHMYQPDSNIKNGVAGYRAHFPTGPLRPISIESTPSYLYSRTALRAVADRAEPPKVLFILREPAGQIFSLYRYFKNNWRWIPEEMSFPEYISAAKTGSHDFGGNELARDALTNARYVDHLDRWRAVLPQSRMRVLLFEQLLMDQRALAKIVAAWLELDPSFYDSYDFRNDNETYRARSQTVQRLNVAIRSRLPRGVVYRALRSAYRGLNTTRPAPAAAEETEQIAALREEYRDSNARLARSYDLDLSAWT